MLGKFLIILASQRRQESRGIGDERGFARLSAVGNRRQKRSVGFDKQPRDRQPCRGMLQLTAFLKVTIPEIEIYRPSSNARSANASLAVKQ